MLMFDMSLAIADDLLRCDWFGRIKLVITRAVRHLAIATLRMIGGNELFDWQVGYLDIIGYGWCARIGLPF